MIRVRRASGSRLPLGRGTRLRLSAPLVLLGLVIVIVGAPVGVSLALFTAQSTGTGVFGTKTIFPGQRVTPAFEVSDVSSGSAVDRSSPFRAASDGRTSTTSAWSTSFDPARDVEFDLNGPLAVGVPVTSATFDFRMASSGAGQACFYLDVRRISTGATLATYGSAGSPLGCVTGSTLTTFSTSIPVVTSTDLADDLRIRVLGRESTGASMVIDLATVTGSTAYQTFTLYPIVERDSADGTTETLPWGLDAP